MPRPNKIESELTGPQLAEFVERLYQSTDRTLKGVQSLAGEYGVEVSLMGAKTFRDNTFESHMERLRKTQAKIEQVALIAKSGAAQDMNEATAAILAGELYDHVNEMLDGEGDLDIGAVSKVLHRLRTGDQNQKILEARLKESDAKLKIAEKKTLEHEAFVEGLRSEIATLKKSGNSALTPEALEALEAHFNQSPK